MLIEFSVENYRSFKDKVTFSMEKGIGDENEINIFKFENLELLKSSAIYGANASGKTNLIRAFTTAIMMIRQSNIIPVGGRWNTIVPFILDEKSKRKPTTFEFVFVANKTKYKYSFSADSNRIYEESLDAYYSQKPSSIFKRTNVDKYEFPNNDENKLRSIVSKNTENKLFLATATTFFTVVNQIMN